MRKITEMNLAELERYVDRLENRRCDFDDMELERDSVRYIRISMKIQKIRDRIYKLKMR